MATVTAYTAERMKAIEDSAVVDGDVVGDNLHLIRHDGGVIDAGNVRGPTGTPGVSNAELDAWMKDNLPICTVLDYLGIVAPSPKFLTMVGQTVPNGNTLYPDFWAKIPASMKHANGTSIIMPDTRGRVAVCYDPAQPEFDQIIEVGGEKAHILSKAELPASTVSVDPPSINVAVNPPPTNTTGGTHMHPVDLYTNSNGGHIHGFSQTPTPNGNAVMIAAAGFPAPFGLANSPGSGLPVTYASQMDLAGDHLHHVGGYTANEDSTHVHTLDIASFNVPVDIPVFQSGPLGSGAAHNILQSYVVFLKIIKVL
jgi:hypothetical protein